MKNIKQKETQLPGPRCFVCNAPATMSFVLGSVCSHAHYQHASVYSPQATVQSVKFATGQLKAGTIQNPIYPRHITVGQTMMLAGTVGGSWMYFMNDDGFGNVMRGNFTAAQNFMLDPGH